jgi:branched-chain amino acid transport system ATP-binding protein
MLEIQKMSSGYGAIEALKSIDLIVKAGEIVTLIGANGAGKSTTLRNITGLVPITSGDVRFEGISLKEMPPHRIAAAGISLVPEGRAIFANLSVAENLAMGA